MKYVRGDLTRQLRKGNFISPGGIGLITARKVLIGSDFSQKHWKQGAVNFLGILATL